MTNVAHHQFGGEGMFRDEEERSCDVHIIRHSALTLGAVVHLHTHSASCTCSRIPISYNTRFLHMPIRCSRGHGTTPAHTRGAHAVEYHSYIRNSIYKVYILTIHTNSHICSEPCTYTQRERSACMYYTCTISTHLR